MLFVVFILNNSLCVFLNFYQAIKAETDGLREELEFVRTLGADLIFACGETEKPEVKKTIDEVRFASEKILKKCRVDSLT